MNKDAVTDKTTYIVLIQALLFIIFLLTTFFFNRFAIDDYYFIGELNTNSFKQIYNDLYYKWHGRWTSNFLLVYFIQFYKIPLFLMLYNIITVGLLYLGIVRLAHSINSFYHFKFNKKTILTYSAIFISVLFFCTISANDTWLWYTSSIVYLWSTIAFFYGANLFFVKHKSFLDYGVFVISAIYIGGSNEPLTIFIILGLLLLLFKNEKIIILSMGLGLITAAFLINYLSPGTLNRDAITPNLSFIDLMLYTGYSSVKFLFFTIHKTFIPALFLSLPFYFVGKNAIIVTDTFKPIQSLIQSVILIVGVVILNQLIVVYALGGLSPDRSSITSSIIIAILAVRYLFLLGSHHKEKDSPIKYVLILNVIGLIAFNLYFASIHYNYAKTFDERIEYILYYKSDIIEVKRLPNSGYIYSSEITTDATHFKNLHLKNGLGIDRDIILSTDQ